MQTGETLVISDGLYKSILRMSYRAMPMTTPMDVFQNWAEVMINPETVMGTLMPDGRWKITIDGPWLLPFAMDSIPLKSMYRLLPRKLVIHGHVIVDMCESCPFDLLCHGRGRNAAGIEFNECKTSWEPFHAIRKEAEKKNAERRKSTQPKTALRVIPG